MGTLYSYPETPGETPSGWNDLKNGLGLPLLLIAPFVPFLIWGHVCDTNRSNLSKQAGQAIQWYDGSIRVSDKDRSMASLEILGREYKPEECTPFNPCFSNNDLKRMINYDKLPKAPESQDAQRRTD